MVLAMNRKPASPRQEPPRVRHVEPAGQRIAKLLARAGVASRRDIERMIGEGRIARDGVVLTTPATVLSSLEGITVDGQPVETAERTRLWLLNKPAGTVTTTFDPRGRPTVFDALSDALPRVMSIGRLDFNTEGLLLLTNDGGLKRHFELPATGMERVYRVRVRGFCDVARLAALRQGVTIDGQRYGAIRAHQDSRTGANAWLTMTITEGKNREIRKICDHLGLQVSRLIRVAYGPFVLDDLPAGQWAEVPPAVLERVLNDGTIGVAQLPAPPERKVAAKAPPVDKPKQQKPKRKPEPKVPVEAAAPPAKRPKKKPGWAVAKAPRGRPVRSRAGSSASRRPPAPGGSS